MEPLSVDLRLRVAAIGIAVVLILILPTLNQVFGLPVPVFKTWRMYHDKGLEVCHTVFVERTADGSEEVLDRFAILAPPDARSRRRLHDLWDERRTHRTAKALCERLGPGRDVRVHRRCADEHAGWLQVESGERSHCAGGRR